MASFCNSCGEKLGLTRRIAGGGLCAPCSRRADEARKTELAAARANAIQARRRYTEILSLISADEGTPELVDDLKTTAAAFSATELQAMNHAALRTYADKVLADEVLTIEEEARFDAVMGALEIGYELSRPDLQDVFYRLIIARVNDGRLPVMPESSIVLKKSEVLHFIVPASLMKEVTLREYQGGYQGVSFRVMKGVRYHTGGSRGRSVVIGTELQVADTGLLSLTSQRAVFVGNRKTVELAYSKLIDLNVYSDGIQFHVSNRQLAPLFTVENGNVVAAVVNGAIQNLL